MEKDQFSKLFEKIPECDIYVSMGCNVVCPYVQGKENQNWGLEDPTGMRDEVFLNIMDEIEKNILNLKEQLLKEEGK